MEQYLIKQIEMDKGVVNTIHALQVKWAGSQWTGNGITYDGIKWLDDQAQKKGITFYDMVFEVLYKHDVNSKAKEWLSTRN